MLTRFKKFFIKTFGCQQNERDSEMTSDYYQSRGFKPAKNWQEADIIIINTCSVRKSAEDRVYGLLNKIKNQKLELKIILTGCMVGLYGKYTLTQKMPNIDEFKTVHEWKLKDGISKKGYVNIMTGCNNFCSYCVVPYARGRERSRPMSEVIKEVQSLVKRGITEITLLGQNVNSYGKELKNFQLSPAPVGAGQAIFNFQKKYNTPFAQLLWILNNLLGVKKISFLTSNPWDLNEEIIEAMSLPKIDRYLHLPVQSGDDEILKKMNRKYTAKQYLDLVKKIRKKIPEIEIGTDIIVGFPGETNEAFQNTVNLCKKLDFVKAYIAMYSPRPKTVAYKLKDDVPYKDKKERWCLLENLINKKK